MKFHYQNIFIILLSVIIVLIIIINFFKNLKAEEFVKNAFKIADIDIIDENNKSNQIINDNTIVVNNKKQFYNYIISKGEMGFGESYMYNYWTTNNLENILLKLLSKYQQIEKYLLKNFIFSISVTLSNRHIYFSSFLPNNTLKSSKKNISSHYDIGNDLYQKMLGPTMQYTCAYYYKDNLTLDQAQKAKMSLVAKKLNLKSGMKVVDIGCGYGSMAQFLAINYNVTVLGVTLSEQQKLYADKYFSHPNVKIQVKDYRYLTGKFDRVYSVGILEHIGVKNYSTYFDKCNELLKDDGIMLVHTIGTSRHYQYNPNEWIKKYIFPEGELPYISKVINYNNIDKWNLEDMQNFGMSYAKTLRSWRKNIGNWEGLEKYNSTFRRMWDFYLYGCAANFQLRKIYLWQFVFTKKGTQLSNDLHHIRKCD